jgi:hypothetical protein
MRAEAAEGPPPFFYANGVDGENAVSANAKCGKDPARLQCWRKNRFDLSDVP